MSDYPLDPVLQEAKNDPWGNPRFYAHGQHPATFRLRQTLRHWRAAGISEDHEGVLYIREKMAAFEEMESIAKADYLRMVER